MDDASLLREFVERRSQSAFQQLVERHTNLVYACALQRLHDAHAAQDVTQAVFLTLALKAKDLRPERPLAGWLFVTTGYVAGHYHRGEQRRKEREMRVVEHQIHADSPSSPAWEDIQCHLNAGLESLGATDRTALLLRFYESASHREIGSALQLSEETAKKRVNRALEKLRCFLTKKGVVLSVTGLAGALTAHVASAAPPGLATTVSGAVLKGTGGTLATTETLMLAKGALKAMFIAKVKTVSLAAAACLVVAGTGVVTAKQLAVLHPATPPGTVDPVLVAQATSPVPQPVDVGSHKPTANSPTLEVVVERGDVVLLGKVTVVKQFQPVGRGMGTTWSSDLKFQANRVLQGEFAAARTYNHKRRSLDDTKAPQFDPAKTYLVVLRLSSPLNPKDDLRYVFRIEEVDGREVKLKTPVPSIPVHPAVSVPQPASPVAGSTAVVWGKTEQGVQVGVVLVKSALGIGDPIEFEIQVRNQGPRPVALTQAGTLVSAGPLHKGWVITVSSGRKTWEANWKPTREMALAPGLVELAAGGTTRLAVSVHPGEWEFVEVGRTGRPGPLKTLPEGRYTLAVAYSQGRPTDTEWWGTLVSGPAAFTVGNPPPAPADVPVHPVPPDQQTLEEQKTREALMKREVGR